VTWLRRQLGAEVEWLPYDLHPEYPPEGIARAELVARYGDHFHDAIRAMAEAAGLPFNPHPDRVPNTRGALELAEWARTQGSEAHGRLHDRLMDAYWREGRDIGAREELAACVADVGLDPADAMSAVESERFREVVDGWTT
jgi:predicted DsbA family dithiol-disulfide isomerase